MILSIPMEESIDAVVRADLEMERIWQYEQNQQYWYEDLGLTIPIVYFITDRKLGHISSTAIKAINSLRTKLK